MAQNLHGLQLSFSGCRKVCFLTGAGISVASGLSTYRGPGGVWEEHDIESIGTAEAISRDPVGVWRAFVPLRRQALAAEPNPAHLAIAQLERRLGDRCEVGIITQNVDGLHQRAGSRNVAEIHGAIGRTRCTGCSTSSYEDASCPEDPPACDGCGSPLRFDVVLFNEMLNLDADRQAKHFLRSCDLFIAVGTSGTVWPASSFVRGARYEGARTVLVNLTPMEPPDPHFQEEHLGRAEELLPKLLQP